MAEPDPVFDVRYAPTPADRERVNALKAALTARFLERLWGMSGNYGVAPGEHQRQRTPDMTSTTETAATIRYALLRSTPDGETYAAGIAPDGTLVSITADLAHEDVEDILEGRANIAEFDFNEPTEGQVETWERDGWETGPRLVEFETRTIVFLVN